MVVFGQSGFFGKSGCIRGKVAAFMQGGCIMAQLWYSCKSCCNRAKVVVIGQKLLYSGKRGSIRAKWLYSSKSGCIRVKVVKFGKNCLYSNKVVLFGQRWLYFSIVV